MRAVASPPQGNVTAHSASPALPTAMGEGKGPDRSRPVFVLLEYFRTRGRDFCLANLEALHALLSLGGETDPESALRFAWTLKAHGAPFLENAVLSGWLKTDPAGAWAWAIEKKGDSVDKNVLVELTFALNAESHLLQVLRTTTNARMRRELAYSIAESWAKTKKEGLAEWMQSLPTQDKSYDAAFAGVISGIAVVEPIVAITWAKDNLTSAVQRSAAIGGATSEWIHRDGYEDAAQWLLSQPQTDDMRFAYANATKAAARSDDFDTAFQLADLLSEPEFRNQTLLAAALETIGRSAASAAEFIPHLSNVRTREFGLDRIFSNWAQQDRAAALTFLNSTQNMTAAEKNAIRARYFSQ